MYFVVGTRGGTTARFQLSFKYRLFDVDAGFGQERPWLSGLYFGYTQNSLWDLRRESKAFRDTSYRPSLFWKWERADDAARLLRRRAPRPRARVERRRRATPRARSTSHSCAPNGAGSVREAAASSSRRRSTPTSTRKRTPTSTTTAATSTGARASTPAGNWIATTRGALRHRGQGQRAARCVAPHARRQVRPGEQATCTCSSSRATARSILDYNVKNKSQLRFGFAIVP